MFFRKTLPFILCIFIAILSAIGLAGCSSENHIDGIVVDYDTRHPVEGVRVKALQTGWKISMDSVVWDHTYTFSTVTDAEGKFRLTYDVGSSAKIQTAKEEFVPFDGWFEANTTQTIKIKRRDPHYKRSQFGVLRLGVRDHKPFGWNFEKGEITFDPGTADLFPNFESKQDWSPIQIQTFGEGGLLFRSREELEVSADFLVYTDEAPKEGYEQVSRLDLNETGGVYFVRLRDGSHFAKFEFNPGAYATEGGSSGYSQGNWGLLLMYVYNRDGGRYLKYEK